MLASISRSQGLSSQVLRFLCKLDWERRGRYEEHLHELLMLLARDSEEDVRACMARQMGVVFCSIVPECCHSLLHK